MSRKTVSRPSSDALSSSIVAPVVKSDEQELISQLSARYDKLNALWKSAEEQLRQFLLPVDVTYCYRSYVDSEDPESLHYNLQTHESLGWVKWQGSWRLCFGLGDDRHGETWWKPITDCTVDRRMACISHFAKLRQMVVEKAKETVPQLDSAISDLTAALQ